MMNGATQLSIVLSYFGIIILGWSAPLKPGVRPKLLPNIFTRPGFLAIAFIVSFRLAAVPPEKVPSIERTRPRILVAGLPYRFFISCCSIQTPRSNGMESKPQEKQICAPDSSAAF